jgi:V/A-type H+/Na+-transporting ATPase subunit E
MYLDGQGGIMTLESVKEELLNSAKAKAKQAVEQARKDGMAIVKNAEDGFAERKKAFEEETKAMVMGIKAREKSAANLEAKKLLFEEKRNRIDEVFASAKKALANLHVKEREKLVYQLLDKAAKEISIGKVYCCADDEKFVRDYPIGQISVCGGIIAESTDGSMRVDYSLDTMLAEYREKQLNEVVSVLFG